MFDILFQYNNITHKDLYCNEYHMTMDANLKQILAEMLGDNIETRDSISVGKLPLEIDLVLSLNTENKPTQQIFENLIRSGVKPLKDVFAHSNYITFVSEFKSRGDRSQIRDCFKLQGYW